MVSVEVFRTMRRNLTRVPNATESGASSDTLSMKKRVLGRRATRAAGDKREMECRLNRAEGAAEY